MTQNIRIKELLKRGVILPSPDSVTIDDSVDLNRISSSAVIHAGCRLTGAGTSIGEHCILGEEGPVTLQNCQLAARVELKGGFFSGAVFLESVVCGSGAHVRPGTLMEEHSSIAHTVGLKQTLLMPYVTLGSLINFCDCLMSGGTDRKNHSEVGSSYVHFNYTPQQDKATASLIGDVPRGVMLDQRPIFLGGQGGLVGPARIEYGTVIGAGCVCRSDITESGQLVMFHTPKIRRTFDASTYSETDRKTRNNLLYIGNLHALRQWYVHVRARFLSSSVWDAACHEGAIGQLDVMIEERMKRLVDFLSRLKSGPSGDAAKFKDASETPDLEQKRDVFLERLAGKISPSNYVKTIQALDPETKAAGTAWLQSIVDAVAPPTTEHTAGRRSGE